MACKRARSILLQIGISVISLSIICINGHCGPSDPQRPPNGPRSPRKDLEGPARPQMTSKGPKTTLRCPQKDHERTSGGGPVSTPNCLQRAPVTLNLDPPRKDLWGPARPRMTSNGPRTTLKCPQKRRDRLAFSCE